MKSKTTLMLGLMILGCLGLAACDGGGAAPDGDAPKPAVMAKTTDDVATSIPETDPETDDAGEADETGTKAEKYLGSDDTIAVPVFPPSGNDPNTPPPPAPKPDRHKDDDTHYEIAGRATEYAAPLAPRPLEHTPVPCINQEYAAPPAEVPVMITRNNGDVAVAYRPN